MTGQELIDRYEAGERDFQGANLEEMDLSYAYLVDANFQGANFRGANLTNTNFSYSILLEANFADVITGRADSPVQKKVEQERRRARRQIAYKKVGNQ